MCIRDSSLSLLFSSLLFSSLLFSPLLCSSLPLLFLSAVAVLFTMEDSSKIFAIGNIEEVAVADGTVDARRATGSSSAEYLRQLSMSQRSNGVFINDPKGLFILRWYREVKGDGTPPDGPRYQNRACKYYKLTSDNDGEAFQTQCGRQEDLVTSTMKKMVGPEAE